MLAELQNLGLSEEESKIYLVLLELGGAYVSVLARKTSLPRVNCYYTLDKLKSKGLVTSFDKGKIKYFTAEHPQVLVNDKEREYERAQKLLPELLSVTNSLAFKPKIRFYEGMDGIKTIFEDTLQAEEEVLGYTNLKACTDFLDDDFLKEYCAKKIQAGLKTRFISPSSKEAFEFLDKYYPKDFDTNLAELFFVNPEEFYFENEIHIYGNKLSIISLNPDELMGVIIESRVLARTQKAIFNLSWFGATSFVAR